MALVADGIWAAGPPLAWPDLERMPAGPVAGLASGFAAARPYKHVVLDGLFPPATLDRLSAEYDAVPVTDWHRQTGPLQQKRRTRHNTALPNLAQSYFDFVNSGPFIRFLTRVTGIEDLIPDPALHGGGMHEVQGGGFFEIHVDFPRHPQTRLDNRLVVITYLNKDWEAEHGGALELWQREPAQCVESILPEFGRTVILAQSGDALHGHPGPVDPTRTRRALITYFYTNGLQHRSASPGLQTEYLRRPGQNWAQRAEALLRPVTPPVVVAGIARLHRIANGRVQARELATAGEPPPR